MEDNGRWSYKQEVKKDLCGKKDKKYYMRQICSWGDKSQFELYLSEDEQTSG